MKKTKAKIYIAAQELFQFSLTTYLLLSLGEALKEGFISSIFDSNILLIVVIISGLAMVLTYIEEMPLQHHEKKLGNTMQNSFVFAVIGSLLVYYKTHELGVLSYALTVLTVIIIMLFSLLIFWEDKS